MQRISLTGLVCFFFFSICGKAQQSAGTTYTLKQCVETGIANNLDVRKADLQMQTSKVNWNQSRLNVLPNLNGSIDHGINQGRNIDPTTNAYINQKIKFAGYNLNSNLVLFNGFYIQNTIKQNSYAYEASKMDWQQAKDDLTLNIILAYLQVLSNEDLLSQNQNQSVLSQKQVQRLGVLNDEGSIKPSDLSDLRGQLANDQLSIIATQNALEAARIDLCALMNIPYDKSMKLERIDPATFSLNYQSTAKQIYETSLNQFALIRSASLQTKSAQATVRAMRGLLFPSLNLNGNANSNYSSSDQGNKYGKQLDNNFSTTVALSLRIPIFNSWLTRNRIRLAKITASTFEYIEQTARTQLQQDVERAYLNMTTSFDRYKVLLEQVNAYTESFKAAEIRFNEGVGNSIDYLTAKNNLDRSNYNFITSKYEYLLRTRLLDYYQGQMSW
jgi:outer membrane protein